MRHGNHSSDASIATDNVPAYAAGAGSAASVQPSRGGDSRRRPSAPRRGALWQVLGIIAELLLTAAAICALYIVWQMWWTGVEAEQAQNETAQSVNWSDPSNNGGDVKVAEAQEGDPPVQTRKTGVWRSDRTGVHPSFWLSVAPQLGGGHHAGATEPARSGALSRHPDAWSGRQLCRSWPS